MAKKRMKALDWVGWIVALVVSLGIGGLFINGTFMDVIILKILPLIIHQIVGWIVIGTAIWAFISRMIK